MAENKNLPCQQGPSATAWWWCLWVFQSQQSWIERAGGSQERTLFDAEFTHQEQATFWSSGSRCQGLRGSSQDFWKRGPCAKGWWWLGFRLGFGQAQPSKCAWGSQEASSLFDSEFVCQICWTFGSSGSRWCQGSCGSSEDFCKRGPCAKGWWWLGFRLGFGQAQPSKCAWGSQEASSLFDSEFVCQICWTFGSSGSRWCQGSCGSSEDFCKRGPCAKGWWWLGFRPLGFGQAQPSKCAWGSQEASSLFDSEFVY